MGSKVCNMSYEQFMNNYLESENNHHIHMSHSKLLSMVIVKLFLRIVKYF